MQKKIISIDRCVRDTSRVKTDKELNLRCAQPIEYTMKIIFFFTHIKRRENIFSLCDYSLDPYAMTTTRYYRINRIQTPYNMVFAVVLFCFGVVSTVFFSTFIRTIQYFQNEKITFFSHLQQTQNRL